MPVLNNQNPPASPNFPINYTCCLQSLHSNPCLAVARRVQARRSIPNFIGTHAVECHPVVKLLADLGDEWHIGRGDCLRSFFPLQSTADLKNREKPVPWPGAF